MKNSGPITGRTPWRGTGAAIVKKSNRLPVVSASSSVATVAITATTATTATPAATTAAPAAAAAAIAAILTLPGLVHGQFASHEILTVEFLNGSLCFLVTGISHEAEAP